MKHVSHLVVVGVLGLIAAGIAVSAFTAMVDDSFGTHELGQYYRKDSVAERAKSPPLSYADSESCLISACHGENAEDEVLRITLGGGHARIKCQACHGPAHGHASSGGEEDPPVIWTSDRRLPATESEALEPEALDEYLAAMARDLVPFCMECHQTLAGKPRSFPQIDSLESHSKMMGEGDEAGCTWCHDYHTCEAQ